MKVKHLWVTAFCTLAFFGCDDNTGSMGLDLLPDSDLITVGTKTFKVHTKSISLDSIFAKTNMGYIGKYTDPDFGYYETSFLTQLNSTDSLSFPEPYDDNAHTGIMAGDSVHLTQLIFSYPSGSYFGDSLTAARMSVYELNKKLQKNHYTNVDPELYYNPADLLGRKAYTAVDLSIPQSRRDSVGNFITFNLSNNVGNRILKKYRDNANNFVNAEAFIENVFKGIYAKADHGDGVILYVDNVALDVIFNCHYVDSTTNEKLKKQDGTDSIYQSYRRFSSTKEVIQANRVENSDKLIEKIAEGEWTYVKAPAGIMTEATLPVQDIYNELSKDTLSAVKIEFTGYPQKDDGMFSMSAPSAVLLIRADERIKFFEENKLSNNITSYTASYSSNRYTFSNISQLITACIGQKETAKKEAGENWNEEEWEKKNPNWNKVVLIPITLVTQQVSSSSVEVIGINNSMKPEYVKLRGGEKDSLDLKVDYIRFNNN